MVQLVVEEQNSGSLHFLDISDVSIKGNYSAREIQDIGEQKSDFTQSFSLPQTKENNDFFSHFYNINSSDGAFDSSIKARASIYVDSNLVFEGYLQLLSVNNKTQFYEAVVFGEIANIARSLSERKLNQLDLSEFNHVLSDTNQILSWSGAMPYVSGASGDEILYPIIDYGYGYTNESLNGNSTTGGLLPSRLKPTIKVRTLFEKILSSIGYTVNSSFFAEDFFDKQYMTLNQEFQTVMSSFQDGFKVGLTGDQVISSLSTLQLSDNSSTGFFDLNGNFDTSSYYYSAALTGLTSFKLKMRFQISSFATIISTVKIKKFNDPLFQYEFSGAWNGSNNSIIDITVGVQEVEIVSDNLMVSAGDQIYVEITWSTASASTLTVFDTGTEFSLFTAPISNELSTVELGVDNQVMPADLQVDFISSILSRYNLIIALDKDVPFQLNIEPAQDYYDSGTSYDWSDKLDNNKDVIIKPTNEFRKAKIDFKDLEGEGALNTYWQNEFKVIYNSYEQDLEGDFGEGTLEVKTMFESFNCKRLPDHDMLVSKAYKYDNGDIVFCQSKPQLFIYSGLKDCQQYRFWSQTSGTYQVLTQYPFIHHYLMAGNDVQYTDKDIRFKTKYAFDQPYFVLSWPTTDVYSRCWRRHLNNIYNEDARILTANFYLQPEDIANFKYNDKIFINDNYYRINKISSYALGKNMSTKVELLKLIDNNALNDNNGALGCNIIWNQSLINGTTNWINAAGSPVSPSQECCEAQNLTFVDNVCYWNYTTYNEPQEPPIGWEQGANVNTTGGTIQFNKLATTIKTNLDQSPNIYFGGQIRQLGKVAGNNEYLRWSSAQNQTVWGVAVSKIIAGTNVTISPASGIGDVTINATGGGGGTPASPTNSVQYNDGGSFGGDAAFTFDDTTEDLTVTRVNSIFYGSNNSGRSYASSGTTLRYYLHAQDFHFGNDTRYFMYTSNGAAGSQQTGYNSSANHRIASVYLPLGYRVEFVNVYASGNVQFDVHKSPHNTSAFGGVGGPGTTNTTLTLSTPHVVQPGEYVIIIVQSDRATFQMYGAEFILTKI